MSENNLRYALSDFLFTIYDHGTRPNALAEADAILHFLLEASKQEIASIREKAYNEGYEEGAMDWR